MASEIIGRAEELERLRLFLDTAADAPAALVLTGDAGIGKSTLWLASLELARERGLRVLSSRPAEAERDLAFAGLGDLFEGCLDEVLPRLPPPRRRALEVALLLEQGDEPLDPRALGVAVRSALDALAQAEPLLLAVDDVQWLDGSTADVLAFALRRLTTPLRIVLAQRAGSTQLETSLADVEHVHVGPMSAGALQTLLRQRLERVLTRRTLLRVHETSGGNPFYALELARALPHRHEAGAEVPVPETLEELVRARIDALPESSVRALVLLSAMGEGDSDLFRKADAGDSLDAAVTAGIVERRGSRLRFAHPLLSSSVYQGADSATVRACHALLADLVPDPLERARHLALSTDDPSAEIAIVLDEAADSAYELGAIGAVVPLRRHALRLTPADADTDRLRRMIALGRAERAAGTPASSVQELLDDVVGRAAPGTARADALLLSAEFAGDFPTGVSLRRQALAEASDDPALQARLHRDLAWDVAFVDGLEAAERHARSCLEIGEQLDDDALRAAGLTALSTVRFHLGEPDALRLGEEAYDLACTAAEPKDLVRDTLSFVSSLMWSSQLERARALLDPIDRDWCARDEAISQHVLFRRSCVELLAGRLRAAADLADRAHEIAEAYEAVAPAGIWLLAEIAAWRGDLERARDVIEGVRVHAEEVPWFKPSVEGLLGQIALWSGSLESAIEHLASAEDARALGSLEPNLARWRPDYVEALVQSGRESDAMPLLDSWEAEGARLERQVVLAQVTRCRGLVAAAQGDVATAATVLQRAVEEHSAAGDPLGRARALLTLGVVERRARRRGAARAAIEQAVAIFDECGARGWAEKARTELGRIAGRTREQGLTQAERRVAALVAAGRTNREVAAALVLGERTVETHLTHIYAKLGVRSRAELARTYEPAS